MEAAITALRAERQLRVANFTASKAQARGKNFDAGDQQPERLEALIPALSAEGQLRVANNRSSTAQARWQMAEQIAEHDGAGSKGSASKAEEARARAEEARAKAREEARARAEEARAAFFSRKKADSEAKRVQEQAAQAQEKKRAEEGEAAAVAVHKGAALASPRSSQVSKSLVSPQRSKGTPEGAGASDMGAFWSDVRGLKMCEQFKAPRPLWVLLQTQQV